MDRDLANENWLIIVKICSSSSNNRKFTLLEKVIQGYSRSVTSDDFVWPCRMMVDHKRIYMLISNMTFTIYNYVFGSKTMGLRLKLAKTVTTKLTKKILRNLSLWSLTLRDLDPDSIVYGVRCKNIHKHQYTIAENTYSYAGKQKSSPIYDRL